MSSAVQLEATMHLRLGEQQRSGSANILDRARAGDSEAFEKLVRQFETTVLRLAFRLTGNLGDAQDVSQEVFLKLHRELNRLGNNVQAWLYRVTVNACWDLRRKQGRSRVVAVGDDLAGAVSAEASPEQRALAKADQAMLEAALLTLGERERAAIVLREMEGLSTAEVAAVFGLTETTVRVNISTARVKLREYFRKARERRS